MFVVRRLPVYLLLDTSGSMKHDPETLFSKFLKLLERILNQDLESLESVSLSVITFARHACVALPLTPLRYLQCPQVHPSNSAGTHLGEALSVLVTQAECEVGKSPDRKASDRAPLLFIVTDGQPSDVQLFLGEVQRVKALGFQVIVGVAAGPKAFGQPLAQLCDTVVPLEFPDDGDGHTHMLVVA